jgi:hypothetical protein
MKGISKMDLETATDNIFTKMARSMKEIGFQARDMAEEIWFSKTGIGTLENG